MPWLATPFPFILYLSNKMSFIAGVNLNERVNHEIKILKLVFSNNGPPAYVCIH